MLISLPCYIGAQTSGLANEILYSELEKKVPEVANDPKKVQELIALYTLKAKMEKSPEKLYRAYVLGTIYAENTYKMAYADSMLYKAYQINRPNIIGDALMTNGMLHELNEDYNVALNSYLHAQKYLSVKNNPYLAHVLNLNIARIRNYLGQYRKARVLLVETVDFFRVNHETVHQTDYRVYYMHALIALLDTNSKLSESGLNEELVAEGISFLEKEKLPEFKPYFVGSQGIDAYYRGDYLLAITKLKQTLNLYNDSWKHLTEKFYLGMSFYKSGQEVEALRYFAMIDEEFEKTGKIDPQFRPAFESLYEYYKKTGQVTRQLEYVDKLLKINALYEKNYKDLFQSLSSEYDNIVLRKEKEQLSKQLYTSRLRSGIITAAAAVITLFSGLLAFRYYRRRNHYRKLYEEFTASPGLLQESNTTTPQIVNAALRGEVPYGDPSMSPADEPQLPVIESGKREEPEFVTDKPEATPVPELNPQLLEQILAKLGAFEAEKAYLVKNLTLSTLAAHCGTNSSYLSKVINQHKGQNFNGYLNSLRLDEAIHLWKTEPLTRKLSVQETAVKLGFSTAQSFSKNFQERYHLSPTYFLKRLNSDLPMNGGHPGSHQ